MPETWTFTAPLWRWNAKQESTDPGSWSFVTLPTDVAEDIRDVMVEPPRGFGSVKVQVVVGEERWSTSVFPDKESGSYVLPVKHAVRTSRRHRGGRPGHGHVVAGGQRMSPPRLVATDLDGTLVRSDDTVSAYTQQVLAELDERDVPVVFVTGRPLRWAEEVFDHVGRHGLAVISNGALVWDVAGDRPVAPARHRAGRSASRSPSGSGPPCPGSAFAIETLAGTSLEPQYLERHPVPPGSRRAPIAELLSGQPRSSS